MLVSNICLFKVTFRKKKKKRLSFLNTNFVKHVSRMHIKLSFLMLVNN